MDLQYLYSSILANLPIISLVISLVSAAIAIGSVCLAFLSFRRTGHYQRFEYAPRIEIMDKVEIDAGFKYWAAIENKGMRPIEVKRVFVDAGLRGDPKWHYSVKRRFYLLPDKPEEIELEVSESEVEEIRQKCQESLFRLRVVYFTATGDVAEVTRSLGGYDGQGNKIIELGRSRTLV